MAVRESIVNVRLSPHERQQLARIMSKRGFNTYASCIRYAIDRVYLNEVVKTEWLS
jgi:hypothetical protein